MQVLVQADKDGNKGEEIDALRKEINEMLDDEKINWNQISRVQWLTLGDKNTKYFHHKAFQRKRKNEIRGLLDGEGNCCKEKTDIANIVVGYFKELFSTSFPTRAMKVVDLIPRRITREMNENLTKEFQKEEVIQAILQMHPTKASGTDSMFAIFYQKYLDIIGEDVIKTIFNILNFNASITDLNKTNIALIPKINNPTKINEF